MHMLLRPQQRLGAQIWLFCLCLLTGMTVFSIGAIAQFPQNAESGYPDAVWRVLLVVIEHTTVGSVREKLSQEEIDDAVASFYRFACLVPEFTDGRVQIIPHAIKAMASVTRVSDDGRGGILARCQDVYEILQPLDSSGEWDTLMVFWKRGSLPSKYWGWGGMFTPCGSTYASVTEAPHNSWERDDGEIFWHEWLHGVSSYFERLGYAGRIPAGNADAASQWGYHRTPEGWNCEFYADLMNGAIPYRGAFIGFSRDMWQRGAPRHPANQPVLQAPLGQGCSPLAGGPPGLLCGPPLMQGPMAGIVGFQPVLFRR